jgi:hypothetical protein
MAEVNLTKVFAKADEQKAKERFGPKSLIWEMGVMDDHVREMALQSYGYGCWEAPHWFIGPEQGQARAENNDLTRRIEAWRYWENRELDDCREFHLRIGDTRWHRERPRLQSTWRPLMILFMSFWDKPFDNETLRNYQRDEWATLGGETCVIELSGLAAHSLRVPRDRECFRKERIAVIRERMRYHNPKLVVMYGTTQKDHFEAITGRAFPPDNILKDGARKIALTPAPTSHGLTNAYWEELGKKLRRLS